MEKIKELEYSGDGFVTRLSGNELASKLNEIIDWINKHEESDKEMIKEYRGKLNNVFKMREKENKANMELAKASQDMIKNMVKNINS